MVGVTYLRKGKKGRNREADSVFNLADAVEIGEGHAGDGLALRIALTAKGRLGKHIILIDDPKMLRDIINACEGVLSRREQSRS